MAGADLLGKLRRFDAYPKTLEDFRVKTFSGGALTFVTGVLMIVLFVAELRYYLATEVKPELFVDSSHGQKIKINVDVSFPKLPCLFLSIDVMDVSGEQQIDVTPNLIKKRIPPPDVILDGATEEPVEIGKDEGKAAANAPVLDPNRCESCYGAETPGLTCCNNCDDVREAYRRKGWAFVDPQTIEQCKRDGWSDKLKAQHNEGCRVHGFLEVNKVAGNFHFAPGKSFQQHHVHVHDLQAFGGKKFNLSHSIDRLSFGTEFPGLVNPLDGHKVELEELDAIMFQYFVKVVPTSYHRLSGEVLATNQFSVTKHQKKVGLGGESGLPGVFIMYDMSPMMVQLTETRRSFIHFITSVCAIVGGLFTVSSLVDSLIYNAQRALQKKIELGKAS
eukprot:scpid68113/ scgid8497/ Endoplasmic reticulum-Golgi intermediate compartment protein 3